MDEDDLEGLSDQERAALQGESEDEATLKAIAGKEEPAGKGDDKAEEDEGDDGPAAKGATEKEEEGDDPDKAKKDDKGEPTKDAEPAKAEPEKKESPARADEPAAYTIAAPEDAAEQVKALRSEKAAAFKQLMDGEITPEEYSAKEDEILGKIDTIQRQVTAATVATEITMQNAQRSYLGKVNALLDAAAREGVDYRKDEALHGELDRTVKWLASDAANADKPEQWFLDEAHAMVKARHGLGKAPEPRQDKAATKAGRAPDLSGLPPTVRNVPAAADSDDGGEFAHLSTLKGMQLERALSKLTVEEQQRYLES
jgi:hypothetical protein